MFLMLVPQENPISILVELQRNNYMCSFNAAIRKSWLWHLGIVFTICNGIQISTLSLTPFKSPLESKVSSTHFCQTYHFQQNFSLQTGHLKLCQKRNGKDDLQKNSRNSGKSFPEETIGKNLCGGVVLTKLWEQTTLDLILYCTSSERSNVSSDFGKIADCALQNRSFIKTPVHHRHFSHNVLFKTVSFWNSVYSKDAVCRLQFYNFTRINAIIGVFLRIYQTFAISNLV